MSDERGKPPPPPPPPFRGQRAGRGRSCLPLLLMLLLGLTLLGHAIATRTGIA